MRSSCTHPSTVGHKRAGGLTRGQRGFFLFRDEAERPVGTFGDHLWRQVEASRRKGISRARQAIEGNFAGACGASGGGSARPKQLSEGGKIVFFKCIDLCHKSPILSERLLKSFGDHLDAEQPFCLSFLRKFTTQMQLYY